MPRDLSDVAGTVTIVDGEQLRRDLVFDLRDLERSVPGLQVESGGSRFGASGFRIRGIGGNRVATLLDGAPLPDRFAIGNYSDSARDLLSLGMISRIEVLRGPASTLYGSKAIGGVVALSTHDPRDVLGGRASPAGAVLAGYSADREQWTLGAHTAIGSGDHGWLIAGGTSRASEVNAKGLERGYTRDPQVDERQSFMARYAHTVEGGLRLRGTVQAWTSERRTDVRSLLGTGRFATTTTLVGDDAQHHWRVLLDGETGGNGNVQAIWRVFAFSGDTHQASDEFRTRAVPPVRQQRIFDYEQKGIGAGGDFRYRRFGDAVRHTPSWGFDLLRTEITEQRDAIQTNLVTGARTNVVLGERFPLRDFPRTRTTEGGAYVQDEVEFRDLPLRLIAGLRYEHYGLKTERDAVFGAGTPNVRVTDLNDNYWTPKLGAVWKFSSALQGFFQYVRGYRSPPFNEVNIGLEIPAQNLRALPNPDLKPEKSHGIEVGVRHSSRRLQWSAAVFETRYKDFIASRSPLGPDPATGVLLFQSINLDRATISGIEFSMRRQLESFGGGFTWELGGLALKESASRPISNVDPARLTSAIEYAPPKAEWSARASLTAVGPKSAKALAGGFRAPGYVLVDLTADWRLARNTRLRAGLFNVGDRLAWRWSEVVGRLASDPTLGQLSLPGRYAAVTLEERW
ncbi:MAG TPA: TonB-dependent receptor [Burkholderiales bacterium]|nr:TonB-dependent receptor [Burkholderiales bacterium]